MEPLWVRILDNVETGKIKEVLDQAWAAQGPEGVVVTLANAEMPPADRELAGVRAKLMDVLPGRPIKPDQPDKRLMLLAAVENHLLARSGTEAEGVGHLYDALQADADAGAEPYRRWLPGAVAAIALRRRVAGGRCGECHFPAYLDPAAYSTPRAMEDGFAVRLRAALVERESPAEPTVCLAPWSLLLHDFAEAKLGETVERFVHGFVARLLPSAPHGYCLLLDLAPVPESWPDGWRRPVHTSGPSIGLAVAVAVAEAVDGRPVRRVIATARIDDVGGVWRVHHVGPNKLSGKRKAVTRLGVESAGGPVLFLVATTDALAPALQRDPKDGFHLNAWPGDPPAQVDRLDELFDGPSWQARRIDMLVHYREQANKWAVRPDGPTREALRSLADTLAGDRPPPAAVVSADYEADRAGLVRALVRKLHRAGGPPAFPLALGLGDEDLADDDALAVAVGRTLTALGVTGVNAQAVRRAIRHDPVFLVVYDAGYAPEGRERVTKQLKCLGLDRSRDGERVRKRLLTSGLRMNPTDVLAAGFVDFPPAERKKQAIRGVYPS